MTKIVNFFKKLVGCSEPEIQPNFEIYQAENRLENLEYSGTIEEDVLKCIRDKPFRQRRLSSCAPTVKSIKEFGNMEEMCEKLGEEPDSSVDQISKNQRNNYKRRLSRRYSRKMSITAVPQNLSSTPTSNVPSSSSLHQNIAGSNQNLQNIYKVPSNLDNARQSSCNRISQKTSTSSRISTCQNSRVSQNHNKLNNSTTAFNNNINNNLRKGSIFQNRRISIYSIDSIAGPGNQFLLQNNLNHTNENIQSRASVGQNNIISNQKVPNSQNSSTNNNNNNIGKSVSDKPAGNDQSDLLY